MPTHSPWWYQQRGYVMMVLYGATFWGTYELAHALHLTTVPIVLLAGPAVERVIFAFGAVLVAAGWLLRSWGASYLKAEVVWNRDALANRLYVAGPFRYTRNPLYLGNLFLAAAIGLLMPPIGWPVNILIQIAFIEALIVEEERGLRAQYGTEFERYCAAVPRFFPRISPAPADDVPHGDFPGAMRSETLMAGFVATFATFAVFGLSAEPWAWGFAIIGLIYQYATGTRPL